MKGDFWIALRQTHQIGGMKISSQLANNFDYCSAEFGVLIDKILFSAYSASPR
jgi:hypothetical protein